MKLGLSLAIELNLFIFFPSDIFRYIEYHGYNVIRCDKCAIYICTLHIL